MNKIKGKILLKETGVGIPDLLVAVYDTGSGEISHGDSISPDSDGLRDFNGESLGSVRTDESGTFEISFGEEDTGREDAPDYLLFVLAPEEPGEDFTSRILHISSPVRRNAGELESYLIRLSGVRLKELGIPMPPQPAEAPETIVDRIAATAEANETVNSGIRKIHAKKLNTLRERTKRFTNELKPRIRKALSGVPESLRTSDTFVRQGESIREKGNSVIKRAVAEANTTARTGYLSLTDTQIEELKSFQDEDGSFVDIPEEIIEPLLFGASAGEGGGSVLYRRDPIVRLCRGKTKGEQCLDDTGEGQENGDTSPGENGDTETSEDTVDPVGPDDIPRFVAPLVEEISSPEGPVSFGVVSPQERQDQAKVQKNINSFLLKSGPADVPAFHDFQHLQIAVEHIWQEAIDEGIINLSEDAYKEIVALGGDPCTDPFDVTPGAVVDFVECFQRETEDLERILSEPPAVVITAFDITTEQWNALEEAQQSELKRIAVDLNRSGVDADTRRRLRRQGERLIRYADSKTAADAGRFVHLHDILKELRERIREDYPFTVYAANRQERSLNFGILTTYRQKWNPLNYQVGELVKTVTLAPKEVRKFSKKTTMQKNRSEKEVEKSLRSKEEESRTKLKHKSEILRKAERKTNFDMTTNGSFDLEFAGGTTTTQFGQNAATTSSEAKKSFREAVIKATQELRDERKVEVAAEETFEEEISESWEITNPNDELSLTALYYELQQRYRISEHIHRLTPVIMVAQEMPAPSDIDKEWLIAHDWILKRFALDDSIKPALDYLSSSVVGDEVALGELRKNVQQQRKVVNELREELVVTREQLAFRNTAMQRAIEERAGIIGGEEGLLEDEERLGTAILTGGISEGVSKVGDFFGLGGGGKNKREAARIRQEAAREAQEQAVEEERKLLARLEREVTSLNELTERYTKTLSEHLNRRTQIARLQTHVKQNILYYMQAIWSLEPHDQRYFRLHKVQVPRLRGSKHYTIADAATDRVIHPADPDLNTHEFSVSADIDPEFETADLAEVADLNTLLGFKGNYMIFPLLESNALTDFMIQPYIDTAFGEQAGLHDPDEFGNISLEDFSRYVCCLKEKKPELFGDEEFKSTLKAQFRRLIQSPLRDREEIVVPTDSLYLELLPGENPNLEDFKLMHRAIDVKKVQAETRKMELENIRAAARLLHAESDITLLEDPDIEKKIVIQGDGEDVTVSADDN